MTIKNYRASNPCPICGRYKTAYRDKCHGFITSDGKYAYCSRIEEGQDRAAETFYGKPLYRHRLNESVLPPSPSAIPKYTQVTDAIKKPADKDDKEDMMEALEKVIRSYQADGRWPYPGPFSESQ